MIFLEATLSKIKSTYNLVLCKAYATGLQPYTNCSHAECDTALYNRSLMSSLQFLKQNWVIHEQNSKGIRD